MLRKQQSQYMGTQQGNADYLEGSRVSDKHRQYFCQDPRLSRQRQNVYPFSIFNVETLMQ